LVIFICSELLYNTFIKKSRRNFILHNHQKKIAAINDFCGFGKCSLAVSLPIISAMKIQCCPIPTSIFSNHTGYDSFYFTDFTSHMDKYIEEWAKLGLKFNGILTGYLGSFDQIEIVKTFLDRFKNPDTVSIIDPVMGDRGELYASYSGDLACGMRSLVKYADILTPNLTEACILTDTAYDPDPDDDALFNLCEKLSLMGPKKIVISGIERGEDLLNYIYVCGETPIKVISHKVGPCRAGTGDVFSSIIAADAVNGVELSESVCHAADFIAKCLRRTVELDIPKADGICFEEFLGEI
jgi:pyridoxine kinase